MWRPPAYSLLHCALASCGAVYCNRSCLWVCDSGRAGGRAVSEPYYSQRARNVCVSLSAFFIVYLLWTNKTITIIIMIMMMIGFITVQHSAIMITILFHIPVIYLSPF